MVPVAEGAPAASTNRTRMAINITVRRFFEILVVKRAIVFMISSF